MFRTHNQKTRLSGFVVAVLAAAGLTACSDDDTTAPPDNTTTFTMTIENISDTSATPTPLSPGVWAVTEGGATIFASGEPARDDGLESLAEDGSPSTLGSELEKAEETLSSGMITEAPILPGESAEVTFEAVNGDQFQFATMFVQSNDLFFAPDQNGIDLFDGDMPRTGDLTSRVMLWDAGTEVNEEPGSGPNQAPRQSGPDTGPTEGIVQPVSDGFTYPMTADNIVVSILSAPADSGANFLVTIENLAGSTTALAPGVWAVHQNDGVLFENGVADAGHGLEMLAEDADNSVMASYLDGSADVMASGTFGEGPTAPGGTLTFSFNAEEGDRLSFATMYGESNDLFYAPGEAGIELFPGGFPLGDAMSVDITSQIDLWDAGTEVNQEPGVGSYQAPRQSEAGEGADEGVVQPVDDGYAYPAVANVLRVTLSAN